jgi:hypothetical protein
MGRRETLGRLTAPFEGAGRAKGTVGERRQAVLYGPADGRLVKTGWTSTATQAPGCFERIRCSSARIDLRWSLNFEYPYTRVL